MVRGGGGVHHRGAGLQRLPPPAASVRRGCFPSHDRPPSHVRPTTTPPTTTHPSHPKRRHVDQGQGRLSGGRIGAAPRVDRRAQSAVPLQQGAGCGGQVVEQGGKHGSPFGGGEGAKAEQALGHHDGRRVEGSVAPEHVVDQHQNAVRQPGHRQHRRPTQGDGWGVGGRGSGTAGGRCRPHDDLGCASARHQRVRPIGSPKVEAAVKDWSTIWLRVVGGLGSGVLGVLWVC